MWCVTGHMTHFVNVFRSSLDINVLAKYEGMTFDPEHCLETLEDCQCETAAAAAPPVDEPERSLEFLLLCSLSWAGEFPENIWSHVCRRSLNRCERNPTGR